LLNAQRGNDISLSYLVVQHKKEIIDELDDLNEIVKETLNPHFVKMISSSIFISFLHEDTPK